MTREELISRCLELPDAMVDYPFEDSNLVLRHRSNNKWFGLVCDLEGKLCINLKCEPVEAEFLRRVYEGVRPAWHMNKQHWNTVQVESDVPEENLLAMIRTSYDLTAPKPKGRRAAKN